MTRQNADYGYEIQKLYLEMMLSDAETFVRCQSIFNHELFDRKLQTAAKFINEYVIEHSVLPTYEIVSAATATPLLNPGDLREEHYDWLLTDFETFIKQFLYFIFMISLSFIKISITNATLVKFSCKLHKHSESIVGNIGRFLSGK
jgi:hypothetical protein